MTNDNKKSKNLNVLYTPAGRLNFPQLFEPKSIGDSEQQYYSTNIMLPKVNDEVNKFMHSLNSAVNAIAERDFKEAFKTDGHGKQVAQFRNCVFADGDDSTREDEHGSWIIKAKCKADFEVKVVDRNGERILDDPANKRAYSGCHAKIGLRLYSFKGGASWQQGISATLVAVQTYEVGENIAGKQAVSDEEMTAGFGSTTTPDLSQYEKDLRDLAGGTKQEVGTDDNIFTAT